MKKIFKKYPLYFMTIVLGLLLPPFFTSCNSNPVNPAHRIDPDFILNGVWHNIYDKYFQYEGLEARVTFYNNSVVINNIEPFEINKCTLFINNNEIELIPVFGISYFNKHSLDLEPGDIYNILLEINDISYETVLRMPIKAVIDAPTTIDNPSNYLFTWRLDQNYDVQTVDIILERNDVDEHSQGYVLAELSPSERTFSINLRTIPKKYDFKGVTVGGHNLVRKNGILFNSLTSNSFLIEEEK